MEITVPPRPPPINNRRYGRLTICATTLELTCPTNVAPIANRLYRRLPACRVVNLSGTNHPPDDNSTFPNLSHQTHCELNPPGPVCDPMKETFIGEAITPEDMSFSASPMAAGKPGLPGQFSWKGKKFSIVSVLEEWKEAGDCRHGSGERYFRKHWFRVKTTEDLEMKIYFERQGRSSGGSRWRLYSLRSTEQSAGTSDK